MDKTQKLKLVCSICHKPLTDKTRIDIKPPVNHYAYGIANEITVCKKCAKS